MNLLVANDHPSHSQKEYQQRNLHQINEIPEAKAVEKSLESRKQAEKNNLFNKNNVKDY